MNVVHLALRDLASRVADPGAAVAAAEIGLQQLALARLLGEPLARAVLANVVRTDNSDVVHLPPNTNIAFEFQQGIRRVAVHANLTDNLFLHGIKSLRGSFFVKQRVRSTFLRMRRTRRIL